MSWFCTAALVVAAGVVAEILVPGRPLYHVGWFNVLIAALVVVVFVAGRRRFIASASVRTRAAVTIVIAGTIVAGTSGVANGLFAPDNQTIVGSPGERVHVESLGELLFPVSVGDAAAASVKLERTLRSSVEIGPRGRTTNNFIFRLQSRSVVNVQARDLRGDRLTITQPQGSIFLSPVLLMQHRQTIAGLDLPFDSFAVPAARRVVKAILFSPAQAAMLLRRTVRIGEAAVLFAVDDENERPLPRAIALSVGGRPVRADGLVLQGSVETYPAVDIIAVPNMLATAFGVLLVLGGVFALFRY